MSEANDAELLRRYADDGSEAAFTELVQRHLNSVYFAALRRTNGDVHLAADISQIVFTALAREAAKLARHTLLAGWLYTATRHAAHNAMREEQRRRAREKEAHLMHEANSSPAPAAPPVDLRPVLDEIMDELPERDRVAIWLRFYDGKAFAEIGRQLAASEDAARMRVDRALEKMRVALARRGLVSSTAAVTSALARETGAVAPAGLAASVTQGALAEAAVGAAAGLATLGFMSTAKFTGGGVALALVLGVSVGCNVWMWPRPSAQVADTAGLLASPSAPVAAEEVSLAALARGDLARLKDRLLTAGATDATVRGIVEGVLRRRYRETLIARRAENMKRAWWQEAVGPASMGAPMGLPDDPALLRTMVLDPLERLFGPDPVELAEKAARFAFLPSAHRDAFVALERNYEAALARIPGADKNPALAAGLKREREEKEQQLLAALSPAERAEHDLRFSPTAIALRERMSQIAATEQEYRAITAVLLAADVTGNRARLEVGYAEREQRALDRLVDTLGYDRAIDYIWAGAQEYPTYARLAREAGLPPSTPGRMLQLAAETYERAAEIHRTATLSVPEKRAALLALQQQVKPQLDALLPPAQQQQVGEIGRENHLLGWFTLLGEGRYRHIATTAAGTTGGLLTIGSASVETPLPANAARRQLVVRRPSRGGN